MKGGRVLGVRTMFALKQIILMITTPYLLKRAELANISFTLAGYAIVQTIVVLHACFPVLNLNLALVSKSRPGNVFLQTLEHTPLSCSATNKWVLLTKASAQHFTWQRLQLTA